VFVSSVIVDDQMNVEFGGDALVQAAQEREKLLIADSEGWRSAFRSDGDQYSEVMSISNPN